MSSTQLKLTRASALLRQSNTLLMGALLIAAVLAASHAMAQDTLVPPAPTQQQQVQPDQNEQGQGEHQGQQPLTQQLPEPEQTLEQQAPERPALEQPAPEQPGLEQQAPEQQAVEPPALEQQDAQDQDDGQTQQLQSTPDPAVELSAPDANLPVTEAESQTVAAERDASLPQDLSPWGMFMAADWVVKAVMIGLAIASLITWTIWLAKSLELAGASARARRGLKRIVEAQSLPDAVRTLNGKSGPTALMVRAAAHEMEASRTTLAHGGGPGLKERVTSHLSRIETQAGRRMTRGTGMLATIGSTAPFVGLFGTVWGIMNSFIGISEAQTTNLAVVAPGIAEALLATALGLVAAIPAVMIYNVFARSIAGYRLLLGDASAAVERLVSRDIDRNALSAAGQRAAQAAE